MSLENRFDATFAATLALREKQIQQSYRPIIGIHKWFARRPGTVFRCLLLAEFKGTESLATSYWRAHNLTGVIADPFMGGGTPIYEANRLGLGVIGTDINPMAFWIVRQALTPLDITAFAEVADEIAREVENVVGSLYQTRCLSCGHDAEVKYFLWVKTANCPKCHESNDLFPGYLLAEAVRHPKHVVLCSACGALSEHDQKPTRDNPQPCNSCGAPVQVEGPVQRQRIACRNCSYEFHILGEAAKPPTHRMWALEYACKRCDQDHNGRFFKSADATDVRRFTRAQKLLSKYKDLPIPEDSIPSGDETNRLHRWGYQRYREMFNDRQLLGLGLLLQRITKVNDTGIRHALLTVFSDFLRYQNMLCRYDTYSLKCQDIFSVHGFPVGLIQCENNLLGIVGMGSGAFRHFVKKYIRAKEYCMAPFETSFIGSRKVVKPITGEHILAQLVASVPRLDSREAWLSATAATSIPLGPGSLDGVFTDPPYFDNVQYAELMDFCYIWLRLVLMNEFPEFAPPTTRASAELTGNNTLGRDLRFFTSGLSAIFQHYARALKEGSPFVFTYHHNAPLAYVPLVVSILDAGLDCTATLPAVAEMSASLHIAGKNSSVLDSVFVCRSIPSPARRKTLSQFLVEDTTAMHTAGARISDGDLRCLAAGHIARFAINDLRENWDVSLPLEDRMQFAARKIEEMMRDFDGDSSRTAKNMNEEMVHAPTI